MFIRNPYEWTVQFYGSDPPEEVFRPGILRANALSRQLAERALHLGLHVVLDDGYWTRASRDGRLNWACRSNSMPLFCPKPRRAAG